MDYPLRLADQLRAHLQALRKQRGLTQAQLGQRLGLSQVRIADIEARPGVVSVEQLMQIVSALGATVVLRDTAEGAAPPPEPPASGEKAARQRPRARARTRTAAGGSTAPPPRGGKGSW